MLQNLRHRPHRTMDVDKLLEKLKRQRIEKDVADTERTVGVGCESGGDTGSAGGASAWFAPATDRDSSSTKGTASGAATSSGSGTLWKRAVQGGGGNDVLKAIAAMNAMCEMGSDLPTGESNTLGIDRDLLTGLAHNRVRSVNLTGSEPPLSDISITVLSYAVIRSTSVVTLNIGGSMISPEGCRELGHMLAGNSSLQTLDCTDCGITDEGAVELGRQLYLNTSLRYLNLGFNRIGHISVAIISQVHRVYMS